MNKEGTVTMSISKYESMRDNLVKLEKDYVAIRDRYTCNIEELKVENPVVVSLSKKRSALITDSPIKYTFSPITQTTYWDEIHSNDEVVNALTESNKELVEMNWRLFSELDKMKELESNKVRKWYNFLFKNK